MLKSVVALMLSFAMLMTVVACGNAGDEKPEADTQPITEETEEDVNSEADVETDLVKDPETPSAENVTEEAEETNQDDEKEVSEETSAIESDENETEPAAETENQETESVEEEEPEFEETVYATTSLNVRSGPGTEHDKVGLLKRGEATVRTEVLDNGWSKIQYEDEERYVSSEYLSTEEIQVPSVIAESLSYPLEYSDDTCKITIEKEWYEHAWCYIAHVELEDYDRLATECANGSYNNGYETTSSVAERVDAILCINGCYSAPYLQYPVMRDGEVCHNAACNVPAVYSADTGIFSSPADAGVAGESLSDLAASGEVKDTFCFGPAFLTDGEISVGNDASRAQRTFIGTNGEPGDFYLVVSEGRNVDGESSGLTYKECASLLQDYGCTFGVPLDGGGSSTMVFNGVVLNHLPNEEERAVVDFVYIR